MSMQALAQEKIDSTSSFSTPHCGVLQRKCACGGSAGPSGECSACGRKRLSGGRLQTKLRIGAANDPLEREADRVADEVVGGSSINSLLRTNEARMPPIKTMMQRRIGVQDDTSVAPNSVQTALRYSGHSLDSSTRKFMESRFNYDFSRVRIHSDGIAAESARSVNAVAYTVGRDLVFAQGQYVPHSTSGRRLLAHELAHVVQQGGRTAVASPKENTVYRTNGSGTPKVVSPVAPNAAQSRIIEAARSAAALRTQIARFRVSGIVAPGRPGSPDPGLRWRQRARSLARTMFEWRNPNMEQVSEIVLSMVGHLMNPRVMVAHQNDPECGNRGAYVRGLRPPIVLCPLFFTATAEERIRTMIHEAAHLAGIGSGALGESYCVIFDCSTSCGGFSSADSWAHFVHCLSGQTPDQPIQIQAGGGNP